MFIFFELAFCASFNFLFDSSSLAPLASVVSSNVSSNARFFEDFFPPASCLLSSLPFLPFLSSLVVPFLLLSSPPEPTKYFFAGRGFLSFTDSNNQSRLTTSHVLISQAVLSIHVNHQILTPHPQPPKKHYDSRKRLTFSTLLLHVFLRRYQMRTLRRDARAERAALVFYQGLEVRCSDHEYASSALYPQLFYHQHAWIACEVEGGNNYTVYSPGTSH